MTVQFDAVQCVFYYKINKTLLLGNFTVQTLLIRSPSLKSTLSAYWAGGEGGAGDQPGHPGPGMARDVRDGQEGERQAHRGKGR